MLASELTLKVQREAKADSILTNSNFSLMPLHLIRIPSNSASCANRKQDNNSTGVPPKANQ